MYDDRVRTVFTIPPQKVQFRGLIENTKFMNAEHAYKCYRSFTVLVVSSCDKTKKKYRQRQNILTNLKDKGICSSIVRKANSKYKSNELKFPIYNIKK